MYNWSTDENLLKKTPEAYAIWQLEQLINFGIGDKKLPLKSLKKYWHQLQIDPHRKAFLELILSDD